MPWHRVCRLTQLRVSSTASSGGHGPLLLALAYDHDIPDTVASQVATRHSRPSGVSLPPAPPRHPRHGLRSLAAGARNQSTPYKKCVPDLPPGKHLCQDARRPGGPMGWIAKRSTRRPGCGGWVWLASRVPPHARSACTPNWSAVATLSCAYAHQTHSKSRQASRRALRSSLPSVRIPGQDRPVLAPRYRNADHQSGRSGVHRSQPRGASCINSSPPRKCPQNATTTSRVLGRSSFGALPLRLHTAPR